MVDVHVMRALYRQWDGRIDSGMDILWPPSTSVDVSIHAKYPIQLT